MDSNFKEFLQKQFFNAYDRVRFKQNWTIYMHGN